MTASAPPLSALVPSGSEESAWYCLRAQPKREHIAAVHLRQQAGVEVFAPRLRFQRPRLGGKAWRTEALFPGYLFARFVLAGRWREIQYAHAVRGIVCFGEKHPVVPAAMIERLRASMGADELTVSEPAMEAGEEVIVIGGAFAGMQTVLTRYLPAKDRVLILMNFLGRQMEVEVAAPLVIPVRRKHPFRSDADA